MSNIYFKCPHCRHQLLADETRRGMPMECPECHAAIATPTGLNIQQCPQCGQRLMVAPEMKGALIHCSGCQEAVRVPGLATEAETGEASVGMLCPHCHATVKVFEEISNRPAPCPKCGEQVYFRDTVGFKGRPDAGAPKPKGYDELRFRRTSR